MGARLTTTWPQVLAWRLGRQLLEPVGQVPAPEIVRRLAGVQAQVPAAAALAVAVRQLHPVVGAVDRALQEGTLMRTWAMRGTLHLLTPEEAGAYLSLMAAARTWERASWTRAFGLSPSEMVALTEAVGDVLDDQVLSREELVAAVAGRLGRPDMEQELRSGWGAVFKPVAWQGVICHAPVDGNRVAFARPDRLLDRWAGVPDPDDAAQVAVPAYLRTYGPATVERFDSWLTRATSKKRDLRGWFASLEDRLVTVEIAGEEAPGTAYLLAEDADDLAGTSPSTSVLLLPGFDQYVLGHGTAAAEIIPPEHRSAVSRTAGWISPVVVAGGRVVGTWEVADGAPQVRLFPGVEPPPAAALATEIERMARLLQL